MSGDVRVTAAALSDAAIAVELERRRVRLAAQDVTAVETVAMLCWETRGTRFATPLAVVRHVLDGVSVTALPGAPAAVIGVFARRGVIHTLFDPAAALGLEPAGGAAGAVLLVRQDRPYVAIRVDAVQDVIQVPSAAVADAARGDGITQLIVMPDAPPITIVDMGSLIGHLTGRGGAVPAVPPPQEG
jgi:chemotaxis signal transduction protein